MPHRGKSRCHGGDLVNTGIEVGEDISSIAVARSVPLNTRPYADCVNGRRRNCGDCRGSGTRIYWNALADKGDTEKQLSILSASRTRGYRGAIFAPDETLASRSIVLQVVNSRLPVMIVDDELGPPQRLTFPTSQTTKPPVKNWLRNGLRGPPRMRFRRHHRHQSATQKRTVTRGKVWDGTRQHRVQYTHQHEALRRFSRHASTTDCTGSTERGGTCRRNRCSDIGCCGALDWCSRLR